jgi:hypothetical protein
MARYRDLYLHYTKIHKIKISMPPAEFEPVITAWERPQTYAHSMTLQVESVEIWRDMS